MTPEHKEAEQKMKVDLLLEQLISLNRVQVNLLKEILAELRKARPSRYKIDAR